MRKVGLAARLSTVKPELGTTWWLRGASHVALSRSAGTTVDVDFSYAGSLSRFYVPARVSPH